MFRVHRPIIGEPHVYNRQFITISPSLYSIFIPTKFPYYIHTRHEYLIKIHKKYRTWLLQTIDYFTTIPIYRAITLKQNAVFFLNFFSNPNYHSKFSKYTIQEGKKKTFSSKREVKKCMWDIKNYLMWFLDLPHGSHRGTHTHELRAHLYSLTCMRIHVYMF